MGVSGRDFQLPLHQDAAVCVVHGFARLALDRAIGGRDADRDELAAALVPAMIRLLDLPPEPPS